MQSGGDHPQDRRLSPDERMRSLPVPVLRLVPQPALDEIGAELIVGDDADGLLQMSASLSYILRGDAPDPGSDDVAEHPDAVLLDGVRTTWHLNRSERNGLVPVLLAHVAEVLIGHLSDAALDGGSGDPPAPYAVSARAVRRNVPVLVGGREENGVEIDTDPFIYALGAELANGSLLTAVLPRDELPRLRIAFGRRP
ncbi:hypothetical protein [Microbacterium caowuchunii]|uniref:Uncharacterized protein n=1 Tax=Microbacterium caowuchunii TaxID=2614638 RepID=A0A5N0T857_9MICO|nr:hypothetical protein [Microbacterium caowuchunii]KAA9131110.1 hypothetical protein F6B40_12440 [Microbacterium caowuchunii]